MPDKYFAESNIDGTRRLYYKRFLYRNIMKERAEQNRHIVNFNFGEKFLFGRVDRYHTPMIFKSTNNLQYFNQSYVEGDSQLAAADFIVDAFHDMMTDFKKALIIGQIAKTSEFLSNIKVHKAYADPRLKYDSYVKDFNSQIRRRFVTRSLIIKNFSEFITHFKSILLTSGEGVKRYPYTMPAYLKSRLCPINCSALAIEIANLNASNDSAKIDFINDPNWPFFVNACNKNGFMIDLNVPWRIVADIDAPVMRIRANSRTTTALIRSYYISGWSRYYAGFKERLLSLYNNFKDDAYRETHICENGTTINKVGLPEEYTVEELKETFSEEYFMRLYFEIRFAEEESKFTPAQQTSLVNQLISAHRADGHPTSAIFMFERILNKTFDYNGSISYIVKARKDIEEEKMSDYRSQTINMGGAIETGGGY